MIIYQATIDFHSSLEEVDTLLALAEADDSETRYKVLLKSALILLAGKFEAFAEDIAEEYLFSLNELKPLAKEVPLPIKIHHTLKAIKLADKFRHKDRIQDGEKIFTEIAMLWSSDLHAPKLNVDCCFSYGSHGEDELRKLFWNVGIENVFEYVVLEKNQDSLLDTVENDLDKVKIDFKGTFNSITNIRNNIIHQDATPNLTIPQIKDYRYLMQNFSTVLEAKLQNTIQVISEACNSTST
ncbi:MAG: HEPN domain-containing protein [Methylobacter sp.]|nr:HEPN domain-containing protein [Methylobacter sp.]